MRTGVNVCLIREDLDRLLLVTTHTGAPPG
jgi:hypothetical protein